MPIYKRCSRCGKRTQSGTTCTCGRRRHKEYDRYQRDQKSKKYYDSGEWDRKRKEALDLDDNLDVYLFMTEGRAVIADTVHHIIPIKDDWSMRNDVGNLMSLSHDTHSMVEQRYKENKKEMQELLRDMLRRYREGGGAV